MTGLSHKDKITKSLEFAYKIATELLSWKLLDYETGKQCDCWLKNDSPKLDASCDDGWYWIGRTGKKEAHDFSPYFEITDAMEAVNIYNPQEFSVIKVKNNWEATIDGMKASSKESGSAAITLALIKNIK